MSDTPAKPQPDKFRDLARELECDEDEKAFEETVRKVARTFSNVLELMERWQERSDLTRHDRELPVQCGREEHFGYSHNGEVLFGHLHMDACEIADLARATTFGGSPASLATARP